MACIYKRGGIWWVKYYQRGSRKAVFRSLETGNVRVAESKLKVLEYHLETGDLHAHTETPLAPFLEEYLEHVRLSHPRTTFRNTLSTLRCTFGECCPPLVLPPHGRRRTPSVPPLRVEHLEDITPHMVSDYLRLRIERDRLNAKTANNVRAELHAMINWAIEHKGFRPRSSDYRNPVSQVKRHHESAPQIEFLSLEQIDEQLAALEDERQMQTMVAVLIYAGLRRAELTWLTTDDVDIEKRLIHVRAKTVDGKSWQPKTGVDRVVPISNALFGHLSRYRRHLTTCPWKFPSPEGARWDPDNWSQKLAEQNRLHGLGWTALH